MAAVAQKKNPLDNCLSEFLSEAEDKADQPKTDWAGVRLVSLIIFLGNIQMSVIGMSEWPYMNQLDPDATSTFFGYVSSVSSLGHALFSPLMGFWGSATGKTKPPLITGRIIAIIGCALYSCLELFPSNRRYVMLVCYTIFGISMSSLSVMRGYIAKISTDDDRARAVSCFGLAIMISVVIGPLFQLMFAPLAYPGINLIGGKILLNIYTGPIYIAMITNILSFILVVFFFKEKKEPTPPAKTLQRRPSKVKTALTDDLRSFDLSLALACIFVRMAANMAIVIIHTTTSPMMMSVFGWSNVYTVKVSSFAQATVGFLSLSIFTGFALGILTKFIKERIAAFIALCLFIVFYFVTYPWDPISHPIRIGDASQNITGCNPVTYAWCLTNRAVNPIIYLILMVSVLGIAITLSMIAIDSLYSKILGKIDQGTMQGIFLFCLDIINIGGPLVIAPLFTADGQTYVWLIGGLTIILATICWAAVYRKLPHQKPS
ncbi:hypothetical protein AB6A40_006222 [Gnathostoma spinigerum]|uniref:Major facilitator superfamily (MFS) profile domain-containing protein n=1 Tax=Gnathostoma spinigerum TaxID=75299 RepID=A0ABD6ER76_9BILA